MTAAGTIAALAELVGPENVLTDRSLRPYLSDATEARGLVGVAEAAVKPADAAELAAVVGWCYEHGVAMTARGGGTGYAGGAVPRGGIVISLERLRDLRSFEPLLWRSEVEAGVTTADVRRRARENGLLFPPDPGAAEQSQIGGNAATNAGGPHAFKYGVTGAWVTGLEAVVPPGEIVQFRAGLRKDVADYDLRSLLIGSEGTLGIITSLHLRFIPAPETALPVIATFADEEAGCDAVVACLASGVVPAALEYLDADAIEVVRPAFPGALPPDARFALLAEADGQPDEAARGRDALEETLAPDAIEVAKPADPAAVAALWRWRDGVGLAADAALGGKVSEDITVPVERLHDAIAGTRAIAARHSLRSCSWGHAGDGNLHSTFLFAREDDHARNRALSAASELFELAGDLCGSISGEHGVGLVKSEHLADHLGSEAAVALHRRIKATLDPKRLLNPHKKAVA